MAAIETRLRVGQAGWLLVSSKRGGQIAAAFVAGLPGIPFRQFGGQAFQQRVRLRRAPRASSAARASAAARSSSARSAAAFEVAVFLAKRRQRAAGVAVESLLAFDVLLGLGDALAEALGGFAGARFLGVELLRAATIRR